MKIKLLALLALVTGCSGGNNAVMPAPVSPRTAPVSIEIRVPQAQGSTAQSVSRQGVTPQYVSANTQSIAITQTVANGASISSPVPTVIALTPTSTNCTGSAGSYTCTASVTASLGPDTWTLALYASTNGTGTPLAINSVSATVVAGTNSVPVVLNGVVASLAWSASAINADAAATSSAIPVTLEVLDASGAQIIGPGTFVNASNAAVTISVAVAEVGTSADYFGGFAPNTNAAGTGTLVTSFTAPAGTVQSVNYTGEAQADATVTASATGLTSAALAVTVVPAPITLVNDSTANGSLTGTASPFAFSFIAPYPTSATDFVVNEAGFQPAASGAYTYAQTNTCGTDPTVSSLTTMNAAGWLVLDAPTAQATCAVTITDPFGGSATLNVTVPSSTATATFPVS